MPTTATVLLEVLKQTRNMTFYFFNKINEEHRYTEPEVNGVKLHSAQWIMAHIAWAEYFLLHQSLGIDEVHAPWLEKVKIGAAPCTRDELPLLPEIIETMQTIHQISMKHIATLSDEALEEDSKTGLSLGGDKSLRMMIIHTIRHENVHGGQLDWLVKITGSKQV